MLRSEKTIEYPQHTPLQTCLVLATILGLAAACVLVPWLVLTANTRAMEQAAEAFVRENTSLPYRNLWARATRDEGTWGYVQIRAELGSLDDNLWKEHMAFLTVIKRNDSWQVISHPPLLWRDVWDPPSPEATLEPPLDKR